MPVHDAGKKRQDLLFIFSNKELLTDPLHTSQYLQSCSYYVKVNPRYFTSIQMYFKYGKQKTYSNGVSVG